MSTLFSVSRRVFLGLVGLVIIGWGSSASPVRAAIVDHSGTISAQTTWSRDDVHRINGDLTVNAGVILTIESGTVVKFSSGARLIVGGGLSAVGTSSDKIIFTSYRDDSAGGDTDGGGASSGQPNDWQNIYFLDSVTDALTRLEHCEIRYGGAGSNTSLYMYRANVAIVDCLIRDSSRHGLYLDQSSPTVTRCEVRDCAQEGIYISRASPTIEGCTIESNRHGIYSASATPTIRDNAITGNSGWGIFFNSASSAPRIMGNTITGNYRSARLPASAVPNSTDNNTLAPNAINGLWIRGNTRSTDLRFERLYDGLSHELSTYWIEHQMTIDTGAKWTIDPGVTVKLAADAYLVINGALSAVGTAEDPIAFTSALDDTIGGDLNVDGYNTGPVHGDWQSLFFADSVIDAECALEHCRFRFGGRNNGGMVYAYRCSFPIRNCEVSNSYSSGIRAYQSSLTLEGNEVFANNSHGVLLESTGSHTLTGGRIFGNLSHGIRVENSVALSATGAEIFGNAGQGLSSASNQSIVATGNWWGAADGPGGAQPGSGDQVSGTVDVTGFLTSGAAYSFYNAGPGSGEGTIPLPVVTQGTDTTEFGTSVATRMLYDLDEVVLDYPWQDATRLYDLFVTYYNPDDTSGVGGSRQSLLDGLGTEIHGSRLVSRSSVAILRYGLPGSSHAASDLRLRFIKESGYRSVISAVWIVERKDGVDTTAPTAPITSPAAAEQVTGGTYLVEGTSEDPGGSGVQFVEVGVDSGAGIRWRPVTQLRSDGSWTYRWGLPGDGPQTLYARAIDRAGNVGPDGPAVSVVVNRGAAAAVTGVTAYDTPSDGGSSISIAWTLSADDGAGADDVASYEIERSPSGDGLFAVAGAVSSGVDSFFDTGVDDGELYDYRIVTIDDAGNRSSSATYGPVVSIDNVGGTDTTPPEEVTSLSAIAGNEFAFLSWTRSANSALDLVDQLLDISVDGGASWGVVAPSYDDGGTISLGKEARNRLVGGLANGTGFLFRLRVADSSGNISSGVVSSPVTPSATAVQTVSGTISANVTWAAGVYRVTGNLTVNAGAALTILPGVVVKLNPGVQLTVYGSIVAVGTDAEPIVFTAWSDDSAGGDSNGDGFSQGSPGAWGRLNVYSGGNARLEHCSIRFGGATGTSALYVSSATLAMRSCEVLDSSATGVYAASSGVEIVDTTVARHPSQGVFLDNTGAPVVRGCTIHDCANGLYVRSSRPTIDGNTLRDNSNYGLYFANTTTAPGLTGNIIQNNSLPARIPFHALPGVGTGNVFTPNTREVVEILGNSLTRPLALGEGGVNVYLQVNGTTTIATGVQLEVPAGTVWKFGSQTNMDVQGALLCKGAEGNEIVFTSYRDDEHGGDSNGGGASEGARGDWGRIYFQDSVIDFLCRLEHTIVRFGGYSSNTSIYTYRANITIDSCLVEESSRYGLYLQQSSVLVTDSVVRNCSWDGVFANNGSPTIELSRIEGNRNGIYAASATPRIRDNEIVGNGGWGIYFDSTAAAPVISGNTITGNFRSARLPATAVPNSEDGNTLAPNTINGLWIRGNTRSTNMRFERLHAGQPFELSTYWIEHQLTIASGVKWTVDPGVTVKLAADASLVINGALNAVGTPDLPIAFTSRLDDTLGGDLNLDGANTAPASGDWQSIYFSDSVTDADCVLEHCRIRYGGRNNSASVYAYRCSFPVRNCEISNSYSSGFRSYQSNISFEGNEIFANNEHGINLQSTGSHTLTGGRIFANLSHGISVDGNIALSSTACEIFGNAGRGLSSNSGQTIIATDVWWGAADGPGGEGPGSGDQVVGTIDASSFRTSGSRYGFYNAGPGSGDGGIPLPVVTQGTDTSEFGGSVATRMLYDLDEVVLDFPWQDNSRIYDLFVTYYNPDDTSGVGGSRQSLEDGLGNEIHGSQLISRTLVSTQRFALPTASHATEDLRLRFIRESGYRSVVSALWIVERQTAGDTSAPTANLTAPMAGQQISGSQFFVEGTTDDGSGTGVELAEVGIDAGSGIAWRAVTQMRGDGSFSYRWVLPGDGAYTLHARALDRAGNLGPASAGVSVSVNRVAPAGITGLSAYDTPGDEGESITILWELSSDDGAGANDVTTYVIERAESGGEVFTQVGSVVAGVATFADISAEDGVSYDYRVATLDLAGNRATSAPYGPVISIDNIGGSDTTAPEDISQLSPTVGNEFIYLSWAPSANSALDLVDQLLDISVDGGVSWGTNAPDYDDGGTISLGKDTREKLLEGLVNSTGYRVRIRVVDSSNNVSAGVVSDVLVPSSTAVTNVSGGIGGDVTWAAGVFRVTGNISVNSGGRLTILPGVIVKLNPGVQLILNSGGSLEALGSSGSPIVFTSWNDDDVGGDSNGDGPSSGTPGYWGRIICNGGSSARMDHCVVRYSGNAGTASLYGSSATLNLTSCEIVDGSQNGVYLWRCSAAFTGCTIARHANQGLYVDQTGAVVRGCTIHDTQNGLYLANSDPTIDGNLIRDNRNYGIYFTGARNAPPITNNTIRGNQRPARLPFFSIPDGNSGNVIEPHPHPALEVWGNSLTRPMTLGGGGVNVYHQVSGTATVATGVRLTIPAGIVWKFASGTNFDVQGALFARGEESNKVVFTSYRDDRYGGDTNANGPTSGQPGDWGRIYFQDSVIDFLARLEHTVVAYGGASSNTSIYAYRCNPTFESCEIEHSSRYGIYLQQASGRVEGTEVHDCGWDGIFVNNASPLIVDSVCRVCRNGLYSNNATPRLQDSEFIDNSDWGVYFDNASGAAPLTGCRIVGNFRPAMLPATAMPNSDQGNVLAPNVVNALYIRGNTRTTDLRLETLYAGEPHEISTYWIGGQLTVNTGAKLAIDPGVVVKFSDGAYVVVSGALDAAGTPDKRIVFTSIRDDDFGGDVNYNGYAGSPYNGAWSSIYFADSVTDAECRLENCVIRYGGSNNSSSVYVYRAAFPIRNCEISNSSTAGLRAYQSNMTLEGNDFFSNGGDGLLLQSTGSHTVSGGRFFGNASDGIEVQNSTALSVNGAEFFANLGLGIRSSSNQPIDATGNWWGAIDGPGGEGPGSGDQVSGNVDSSSFLLDGTEYSFFDAGGSAHESYGLGFPNLSGTPSTQWGGNPFQSFLYELDSPVITGEYVGLAAGTPYTLLITYLNLDSGGGVQRVLDIDDNELHPRWDLPTNTYSARLAPVPAGSVESGNLQLRFERLSGLRTVVQGVTLLKNVTLDTVPPTVTLESPANATTITSGRTVVAGTFSDVASGILRVEVGVENLANVGSISWRPATTLSSMGRWSYYWGSLSTGEYRLHARAVDRAGNRATAAQIREVTVDRNGPAPVTGLFAQGLSGFSGAIRATWSLSEDDGAGSDDVARYEIYRRTEGNPEFSKVGEVVAGVDRFDDTTISAGIPYLYYVRTVDEAGNGTNSGVYGPVISTGSVDDTPPEDVTSFAAIPNQVDGSQISVLLSWAGSANSNGDLVDQRLSISLDGIVFGSNHPSYDDGNYLSLGRAARRYQVLDLTAGQEYTFRLTVIDEIPNESPGATVTVTPTGAANEYVTLSGTLAGDTVLEAGVYYISNQLIVPVGSRLTLRPGVVFKFRSGQQLVVYGALLALGSAEAPVVFTSFNDDTVGGDTNADDSSTGSPGYWQRIYFENAATSRLEHSVVRFAGSSNQSIYAYRTPVSFVSSDIVDGSGSGIYQWQSSILVDDCLIARHPQQGLYLDSSSSPVVRDTTVRECGNGIYSNGSTATIVDSQLVDNAGWGIYFTSARSIPPLRGCTVTGNDRPLFIPASGLPDETNTLTPNARPVIHIRGNEISGDTRLRAWADGTPDELSTYVVHGGRINVPTFRFLTIDPGVVMKFVDTGTGIDVYGALVAQGSIDAKIHFTSYSDDTVGGDSNSNGFASTPQAGNWAGLRFYDSFFERETILDHTAIRYAQTGLYLERANVRVENSESSQNSSFGVYVYEGSPSLIGNRVWGNSGDGIRIVRNSAPSITFSEISTNLGDGIEVESSVGGNTIAADNNQIFLNRGFGIRNSASGTVDATQSWWGDVDMSGPNDATNNPDGTGDNITGNVSFDPFRTEIATDYSYVNFSATTGSTSGSLPAPTLVQGELSDEWDGSRRSDRTMAWDPNVVIVDYTGLDPAQRYKIRTSYFSGDASGSIQSLTDGSGNPIHGSIIMPQGAPVQYEFSIPTSYYTDGNLRLQFVHDNPDTSIRVAVTEIWLLRDVAELTPPRFTAVRFNDIDGSASLTEGDTYHFEFSEEMDTSLLVDGTTQANTKLAPEGGLSYGATNAITWSADARTVVVTLTEGFTVTGSELVTPTGLADTFGNPAVGSQRLTDVDTVRPAFIGISWVDADASDAVSLGDQYVFHFTETMNANVIQDGTSDANFHLRPAGGKRYGDFNSVVWAADGRSVAVTITSGYNVLGDEIVVPSSFVRDVAGNQVTGTQPLLGRDGTPPELLAILFDDTDGSETLTLGDRYIFRFNEAMRASALSDSSTEANTNLSPEGGRYGALNRVSWNDAFTEAAVEITAGFTIDGDEIVDPSDLLTDVAGNPVSNTGQLTLVDTVAPTLTLVRGKAASLQGRELDPMPAVDDYRLVIQFGTSMDPAVDPAISLDSDGAIDPVVPPGGTWLTTFYPNDTYETPDITLGPGMDGTVTVGISVAVDPTGNEMELVSNAHSFRLDATAPPAPPFELAATTCSSATLDWSLYVAPPDLTAFRVYLSLADFDSVTGLTPLASLPADALSYEFVGLALDTPYFLAVVAVDSAGNGTSTVDPVALTIARDVPPAITDLSVGAGPDPGTAAVVWDYDASGLCGFSGFALYYQDSDFSSVEGLTPAQTFGPEVRDTVVSGLDRTKTYFFAVVAFNIADELLVDVDSEPWSDGYSGEISEDLTIGGGAEKVIEILQPLVVRAGAEVTVEPGTELLFAPGAGITVEAGVLRIEGTALDPVKLTSLSDVEGGAPERGDWPGILIHTSASGSVLRHVIIDYSEGVVLEGAFPTIEALTVRHTAGAALALRGTSTLITEDALIAFSDVGVETSDSAQLTIRNSVIKQSGVAASQQGASGFIATSNWWGTTDESAIESLVEGTVDTAEFLTGEPLLTPAIGTADGLVQTGSRDVSLRVACRTADEMRISEDSTFAGVPFDTFSSEFDFQLSPGGGQKEVFAQFKSVTGDVSEPVSVAIEYVTEGPVVESFNLTEGQVIERPIDVTATASAVLGVDVIEFSIDGSLVATSPDGEFAYRWDVRDFDNEVHRVGIVARDPAGNFASVERNVVLAVIPPPAPIITAPLDGLVVSSGPITVRGTAERFAPVRLSRNGFVVGTPVANTDGDWEIVGIPLAEGDNHFVAVVEDSVGISEYSNNVNVVLDTGPPAAPILLTPSIRVGVGVELQWTYAETGERPERFDIYRLGVAFSNASQALRIERDYQQLSYIDSSIPDGTFYYGIVGLDSAGNPSVLSNVVSARFDETAPSFAVAYSGTPPFGVGPFEITLSTSEILLQTPSLTILPGASLSPNAVALSQLDDLTYRGTFEVLENTPTGPAQVYVSGRDATGNRFAGAPSGPALVLDTKGPSGSISVNAPAPIQVLDEVELIVTLTLDEDMVLGESPNLVFTPPEGDAVSMILAGSGSSWSGPLTLRPDMGKGLGLFTLETEDSLGNVGTQITTGSSLEIYNTEFPDPPRAPVGLGAIEAKGGVINLSWGSVPSAEIYRVYRSDGDCSTTPTVMIADELTVAEFTDLPPVDGPYCYAVSALRRGAESNLSISVTANSDRTPPNKPENVAVSFGDRGVTLSWSPPSEGEFPAGFFVYRNGVRVASIAAFSFNDHPPTGGLYSYVVASTDDLGNENAADPVEFDLTVGAVSELSALVVQGESPRLTWSSSDASIVGYNVYRSGVLLTADPVAARSFSDASYAGASRVEYAVVGVNADGDESPARTVEVYPVTLRGIVNQNDDGSTEPLVASYFNQLDVTLLNLDVEHPLPLGSLSFEARAAGEQLAGASKNINVPVAAGVPVSDRFAFPSSEGLDEHLITVEARQSGTGSSTVRYRDALTISEVVRPGVAVRLSTAEPPLAGGFATIEVCVENHGFADLDVVVTKGGGALPGDLYVAIENEEGLEISRGEFQGTPPGIRFIGDGRGFMRIAPGSQFCANVQVLVPESLPEDAVLTFRGVAARTFHGLDSQATVEGSALQGTMRSGIVLSEYFGTASADRDVYSDLDTVTITGQAIVRDTGEPLANASLKVGFEIRGFNWFDEVMTDENGDYTYEFNPTIGLAGHFTIWAAHPDVFDIIRQDEFDVYRIYANPPRGEIRMSKADTLGFSVEIFNPGELPLTGFGGSVRAYTIDEEGGEVNEPTLTGTIDYPADFVLGPGQRKRVEMTVSATIDAPDTGVLEYRFISAQGASTVFRATVDLLPAVPVLVVDFPRQGYVDISVDRGGIATTRVTVVNNGLDSLDDVELISPTEIPWMATTLPTDAEGRIFLGDIGVGDSRTFDVVFTPPTDATFGYHEDRLLLRGSNSEQEFEVRLFAQVTSNLSGDVKFKVINILGQALEGATVRMRNTILREDLTPQKTDLIGETTFENVQEGTWSWQVVAPGHSTQAGVVTVLPDQTALVEVFPTRSLVTIEFRVEPVPFTDRYTIIIEQTFETHVPVAALVVDPPQLRFENVEPGFEANFIATATNIGLVALEDLTITGSNTPWGTLEPLIQYAPELGALQSMDVPFRCTYTGEEGGGEGGGADFAGFADCATGGFAGLANSLLSLHAAFRGRSFCFFTPEEAQNLLNVASGLLVMYTLYNAVSTFTSGFNTIVNAISCAAQQIFGGSSGPGGGGGPGTGPSAGFSGAPECFAAGTPIRMADGSRKPIEQVRIGDRVWSPGGKADRVQRVYKTDVNHVREIWYRDESDPVIRRLETTDGHWFWTSSGRWRPAHELRPGDELSTVGDGRAEIVRTERFERESTVYNFDVTSGAFYFANGVLVHQRCGNDLTTAPAVQSPAQRTRK